MCVCAGGTPTGGRYIRPDNERIKPLIALFLEACSCPPPLAHQAEGPGAEVLYYVIDINYFPGVDKIAMFEEKFVQFLYEACTVQMPAA